MTAAETYAARIDARRAQRARLHGAPPPDDPWAGPVAQRFRADPHRPLDANLAVLASYTQPEDVLLDVGGGCWTRRAPPGSALPRGARRRCLARHGHGVHRRGGGGWHPEHALYPRQLA